MTESLAVHDTTSLAGSKAIEYDPSGLTFNRDLSYEEWSTLGGSLSVMREGVNWWIGDWLNYGERSYGEKYTQAVEETGKRHQTLMNIAYVAGQIDHSVRRPEVSWSIHAEVASLDAASQDKILDQAEHDGLTRDEVRELVRSLKRALTPAPAMQPEVTDEPAKPAAVGSEVGDDTGAAGDPGDPPAGAPKMEPGDEPDAVAGWERAEKEVRRLKGVIATMEKATDETSAAKAISSLEEQCAALEGRLQAETTEKNAAIKELKRSQKMLGQLQKLLGVEGVTKVVAAVKGLLK